MKKPIISLICLFFAFYFLSGYSYLPQKSSSAMTTPQNGDYEKAWKKIDSLEAQGLIRSALGEVEVLLAEVRITKIPAQEIKCLIYKSKYLVKLEEQGTLKGIQFMENELKSAVFPTNAVLQSVLAEMYSIYLHDNYWYMSDRTELKNDENLTLETMTQGQLLDLISRLYFESLSHDLLATLPIKDFEVILSKGEDANLRPTLFDFLAFRALNYFSNSRSFLSTPVYEFYLDKEQYFLPVEDFVGFKMESKDSTSSKFRALQLFQRILKAHLNDKNPAALVNADLLRLSFAQEHAVLENKQALYESSLESLAKKYTGQQVCAEINHQLALLYEQQAQNFKPVPFFKEIPSDTVTGKQKWGFKKAKELCESTINQFPDTYGADQCQALLARLNRKNLKVMVEDVNLPDVPLLGKLEYKNVPKVYLKVLRLSDETDNFSQLDWKERLALLNRQPILKQWEIQLPDDGDLHSHSVEFDLPPLSLGAYHVLVSDNNLFSNENGGVALADFQVSNLAVFHMGGGGDDGLRYMIMHRKTGHPLKDVTATFYRQDYSQLSKKYELKKLKTVSSNEDGLIIPQLSERGSIKVVFSKDNDVLKPGTWFGNYPYNRQPVVREPRVQFFLDRAIYRPGQTLFFKGLVTAENQDGLPEILKRHRLTVILKDVNQQTVHELNLTTNEFGTVQGSFALPSSGLLGSMHLETNGGSQYFNVEEYKRPKFEVAFKPVEGLLKLNEQILVTGEAKAYAGNVIDGAKVAYRVVRSVRFPYWPWWSRGWYIPWNTSETEIAFGEVSTNAQGAFTIPFEALPDRSVPADQKPEFTFTIYADVTDITGETQSNTTYLRIGYVALDLNLEMKEEQAVQKMDSIILHSNNLNGQPISSNVTVSVEKLNVPKNIFLERLWEKPDRVLLSEEVFKNLFPLLPYANEEETSSWKSVSTKINQTFTIKGRQKIGLGTVKWDEGVYKVVASAQDAFGAEVRLVKFLTLRDGKNNRPVVPAVLWTQSPENPLEPGEKATIHLATSFESVCVYGEMENRLNSIRKGWMEVKSGRTIIHEVAESDRGNIGFKIFTVRENRPFTADLSFQIPWSNKDLQLEYLTFRDKLLPGQDEEWRIKISGPQKDRVMAEMVATMYDASLDAFAPNNWYLQMFPAYSRWQFWNPILFGTAQSQLTQEAWQPFHKARQRSYDELKLFGWRPEMVSMDYAVPLFDRAEMRMTMAPAAAEESLSYDTAVRTKDMDGAGAEPPLSGSSPATSASPQPAIRKNLKETVFFFPDLKTDQDGNIILKFKMNEALTRWKFLALAHTQSLQSVISQKEVLTQKDLMIMPNLPRFFREGDQITLTAKVANLSEKALSGTATLQLIDARTNEVVDPAMGNLNPQMEFQVAAGQSSAVSWNIALPKGSVSALKIRVTAQSGAMGDGEENVIPVLTNRMLVTESLPLSLRSNTEKKFQFQRMKDVQSPTLQTHQITLEFTDNPAWYAVQALPYLMEFPHECTEQILNRFFANSLATYISNKHPRIKGVFEQWKQYEPDALLSNLQKNEALKSALLEETPWVLDAKSEAQQKAQIALLFDLNRMAYESEKAIAKMAERQEPNGGWSWFPGGPPNWYITQYTVETFGHLKKLGVLQANETDATRTMVENAIRYIDFELLESYRDLEKAVREGRTTWEENHLGYLQIHYLYARSFFLPAGLFLAGKDQMFQPEGILNLDNETQKAVLYYLSQAETYWPKNGLYQQGMISLAMGRMGKNNVAANILRSLKERSIQHDELGSYWKYPAGWWWYQAPLETHALLMEAFAEYGNDPAMVEDLKLWLLKNKQTNHWKTTKATSSAIYALLMEGTDWLANTIPLEFNWAGIAFQSDDFDQEAGTGYFKINLDEQGVNAWQTKPKQAGRENAQLWDIEVKNPNASPAWGAIYWQYFEDLDKITTFEDTPLKLKKKLYRTVASDRGPVLEELTATDGKNATYEGLQVGDKVTVRIELRADRDMEYIHMKDTRASGFEPMNVFSQYKWQGGLGYYESTRDAATHFFMDYLPKGTYVFEYPLRVAQLGDFSNGITTIQCMYAPEFTSHSEGLRVLIKK